MSDDDTKDLFDHLDAVKKDKDPDYWNKLSRQEKKNFSSFMIRRFLSMRREYVPVLNELQPLTQHMEDKDIYRLYAEILPYDDGYYKYISGSESKRTVPDWAIDILKEEFQASESEVRTYIDILMSRKDGKEELLSIFRDYGVQDDKLSRIKQMKK
jgi:hypothetical protein